MKCSLCDYYSNGCPNCGTDQESKDFRDYKKELEKKKEKK
jgi:hypothetical protein